MGRPAKPESERLVPLSTNVRHDVYVALRRIAAARDQPVAALVRDVAAAYLRAQKKSAA